MMLHVSAASRSLKKGTIYIAIWDGCHRVVTPQAFSELLNTAIIYVSVPGDNSRWCTTMRMAMHSKRSPPRSLSSMHTSINVQNEMLARMCTMKFQCLNEVLAQN